MTKETPRDGPRQKTDQELKPGPQMDELLRKIRQLDKRVAFPPELQPPEPAAWKK